MKIISERIIKNLKIIILFTVYMICRLYTAVDYICSYYRIFQFVQLRPVYYQNSRGSYYFVKRFILHVVLLVCEFVLNSVVMVHNFCKCCLNPSSKNNYSTYIVIYKLYILALLRKMIKHLLILSKMSEFDTFL